LTVILKTFFKQLFYLTTILKFIIYVLKINIIDLIKIKKVDIQTRQRMCIRNLFKQGLKNI